MKRILDIGTEASQRFTILFDDNQAVITIKFNKDVANWTMDIEVGDKAAYGVKLSASTPHLRSRNMGVDIVVVDNSGKGEDPFNINDFYRRRCDIYLITDEEIEELGE